MAITDYTNYEYPINAKTAMPLRGCILIVSGFDEDERSFYEHLAIASGAVIDDVYRKHLKQLLIVCATNFKTNEKYLAALEWGKMIDIYEYVFKSKCVVCATWSNSPEY